MTYPEIEVSSMKFLFLMEPLESVNFLKDTTYVLMLAAAQKGHEIYYVPKQGISKRNKDILFHATKVVPLRDENILFDVQGKVRLKGSDADVVFLRPDPPFDQDYLMSTWLLDLLPPSVFVFNRPGGVRCVNEKIWASQFDDLVPSTLVSCYHAELLAFMEEVQDVIAKPTDGFGGQGVFLIKKDDPNKRVILETLTKNESQKIILQRYIPEARKGDKRILLLNGEPLGAILRLHSNDDHRNNFFSGGKPYAAELTPRDLEIIERLKPFLLEMGLFFVGIDIIGEYLIEVNVTSPTCLQEINRAYDKQLEFDVIDFVEHVHASRPAV